MFRVSDVSRLSRTDLASLAGEEPKSVPWGWSGIFTKPVGVALSSRRLPPAKPSSDLTAAREKLDTLASMMLVELSRASSVLPKKVFFSITFLTSGGICYVTMWPQLSTRVGGEEQMPSIFVVSVRLNIVSCRLDCLVTNIPTGRSFSTMQSRI